MLLVLSPVFFLTAAIFGVAAWFFAAFVFELNARMVGRICLLNLALLLLFPPVYFGLYLLASPKDPSDPPVTATAALIPSVWLFSLLLGILIGLWRAWARLRRQSRA